MGRKVGLRPSVLPAPRLMARRFCLIDFETRSRANLRKTAKKPSVGAWCYAEHPSTEITFLGYTFGQKISVLLGGVSQRILGRGPGLFRANCPEFCDAVDDPECVFIAHNVGFEKAIWRHQMLALGWPDILNDRWHDTMAVCAMKGLPLALEKVASALRLPMQKDMEGHKALMAICQPKKDGTWDEDPEKYERVFQYCGGDIGTELGLHRRIRGLRTSERAVWLLDQCINERGVAIDLPFVAAAQEVVDQATVPLLAEFRELTGVNPTQVEKILEWLNKNGVYPHTIEKGEEKPSLSKTTLTRLLGDEDEDAEDSLADAEEDYAGNEPAELSGQCYRALQIRQILGSASIKKLGAIRACTAGDSRARGLLQYHGAGPGRWAGRLFQPHNFPRPTLKEVVGFTDAGEEILGGHDPEALVEAINTGDAEFVRMLYGEPIQAVASSLRHSIVAAPDHSLVVGDYAKIEAVIVLALAGATATAADVIARGSAVYTDMAAKIFKRPVSKADLQLYTVGKNSVLGAGFGMGWKKFQARYGTKLSEDQCKAAINEYREHFAPEVPKLWHALGEASLRTVVDRVPHEAYGVRYELEDAWLTCRLPSGRKLWYFSPEPCRRAMPWDKDDVRLAWRYMAMKAGVWRHVDAYGSHCTENVVQGLARDLLVNGMFNCERENMPVVLTVHDENVGEVPQERADAELLKQAMCDIPQWAKALQIPVDADCKTMRRYAK